MNPYRVIKKKVVFSKGPIHLVDCDVQMKGAGIISRQIIEHPGAVVIIPKLENGKFVLIRQFRFAARNWLWEWPAGGIEPGENLRAAACRELMEECSLKPSKLRLLIQFYPTPGISSEIMYVFLAEKMKTEWACPDADEVIESKMFTLAQIGRMIKNRKIVDAKTILGYYLLRNLS